MSGMTTSDINMYEAGKYNEEIKEQEERQREFLEMQNIYLEGLLEC